MYRFYCYHFAPATALSCVCAVHLHPTYLCIHGGGTEVAPRTTVSCRNVDLTCALNMSFKQYQSACSLPWQATRWLSCAVHHRCIVHALLPLCTSSVDAEVLIFNYPCDGADLYIYIACAIRRFLRRLYHLVPKDCLALHSSSPAISILSLGHCLSGHAWYIH